MVQLNAQLDTSIQFLHTTLIVNAELQHIAVLQREGTAEHTWRRQTHMVQKGAAARACIANVHLSAGLTPHLGMQATNDLAFECHTCLLSIDSGRRGARGRDGLVLGHRRGDRIGRDLNRWSGRIRGRGRIRLTLGIRAPAFRKASNLYSMPVFAQFEFGGNEQERARHV